MYDGAYLQLNSRRVRPRHSSVAIVGVGTTLGIITVNDHILCALSYPLACSGVVYRAGDICRYRDYLEKRRARNDNRRRRVRSSSYLVREEAVGEKLTPCTVISVTTAGDKVATPNVRQSRGC